ncbi:MAG: radical SAM protein [Oscillospiraceae bacterium]|jgi:hypothetical protein|nr:radical SAM protein [Oscillospiraceae bacterium]
MKTVKNFGSVGIMVNYRCTAACRHCLYACSPQRDKRYMTPDTAATICAALKRGGCHSVHIGGGEPFLDFEGLIGVARALGDAGAGIDYVETNAFWAKDAQRTLEKVERLLGAGVDTLCISIDLYHAEYVPWERPVFLAEMCRKAGMGFFLWQERFLAPLSGLRGDRAHTRDEIAAAAGARYIIDTARQYGLRYGGRALNIEAEYGTRTPVNALLDAAPCTSLLSGRHFHVDVYGRFIPAGCTGLSLPLNEIVDGVPAGRYPVFSALLDAGIFGLYSFAREHGFIPDSAGYTSRCALCFHIRHFLTLSGCYDELDVEYYPAALAYYESSQ